MNIRWWWNFWWCWDQDGCGTGRIYVQGSTRQTRSF